MSIGIIMIAGFVRALDKPRLERNNFMKRFPNGSRVCFIGDSLVNENLIVSWVADCYRENFPQEDIRFFNCGSAGGTAEFALNSFEDDCLRLKPTAAVVAFGVNDSAIWALNEKKGMERYSILKRSFEVYKECLEKLCRKILDNNIELILCTPAPYDEYGPSEREALKGGYALLSEYADFARHLAIQNKYTLCDYYAETVKLMQTEKLYGPDHIHPMAHGYYRLAEIFLKNQGLKIGEECDIVQKYPEWNEAVTNYRKLFVAESMVLRKPELPVSEKLELARNYVMQNEDFADDWRTKWFVELCKNYSENRERVDELAAFAEEMYVKEFLNK